ncbi:helicase-related protein [Rubritalea marina]|uniref:helicase-related protein n=1 Tax=Rubritalea marina TaxID=361055 RepID=UPI00037681B9|nr:helicase-related protein [Rubritalea marina]
MEGVSIVAGQRWVSDSEPELGLGMMLKVEHATLEILFPAAEETRCYAIESAPLRRVLFKKGDYITTHEGEEYQVLGSTDQGGLVTYQCEGEVEVAEAMLSDHTGFSKPQDRLFGAQIDENSVFRLRAEALYRQHELRKSPIRGLVGGRTDLLPHQISIVSEVSKRLMPRVLLADEVGLGKTIEACMIMHRLHLTGRADRVLILLPEPLINQWFVELLRRFNMLFSLFDEERCAAIQENDPEANPFLDSQLVITSVEFLAYNETRASQAREAGWDLCIVDEAHHLEWSPEEMSWEYALVESFAWIVDSLLLLTATPQQLGMVGHFARLRLLDPERFCDLEVFLTESEHYGEVAQLIEKIESGAPIEASELSTYSEQIQSIAKSGDKKLLTDALVDSFGTGRVMFRNTRENLQGFPERVAHLEPIEGDDYQDKVAWLVDLIESHAEQKILLICESKEWLDAISESLLERVQINIAQFHEELTLNQRDRNAAYFAEAGGAQLLLCSEIGSEGRNFQFAQHLVLFDLPGDPELLEQRIGRLDRIGQTATIHIHVPYLEASAERAWARWYHEGLGAFESNVHGVTEVFHEVYEALCAVAESGDDEALEALLEVTKQKKVAVGEKLAGGYDKLLEHNSYRPEQAAGVIDAIARADEDEHFEDFVLRMLDELGVELEELEERNYLLKQGKVSSEAFPDLPDEGMSVTFDRTTALSREELQLLSMDHPIVRACFDCLLGTEMGNSAFGVWEAPGEKKIILESYYVVESVAPSSLHVDRFLPVTPVRVAVDHEGKDLSQDKALAQAKLRKGGVRKLLDKSVVKTTLLPKMIDHMEALAKVEMKSVITKAKRAMRKQMKQEIERLNELSEHNPMIGEAEVSALEEHRDALEEAIVSARLRPDAIRMVWKETAI